MISHPEDEGGKGEKGHKCNARKINYELSTPSGLNLQDSTVYIQERSELDVKLDQQIKHVRNHVRRMGESIWFPRRAQHLIHVEWLSTLKPSGIIGIYRKAFWYMYIFMNSLGPDANVRKRATLVKGPAIDVISIMYLVEDLEPVVQVGVSPVRLDNCICDLLHIAINSRFI